MADLPGMARVYPSAFSNQTNGFLGAGYSTDNSSRIQLYDFYKYDPQSNTWSSIPNYPDNIGNYYVGYSVTVSGRPFISLSNQLLTMRELANDTWNSFSTIPEMIDCPAAGVFSIGKKFYVLVGNRINNSVSNSVWEYNTENQTWTKKSNFPGAARYAPASFSIDNYGYYGCGMSTTSQQFKDIWRYDPANDKWIRIEDFPGGIRSHLIGLSAGKSGFMGLGLDFSGPIYFNDFWKYDPR
jgi:N-acetylneuraminic acid mutarotase